MRTGAIVPQKLFRLAKSRLAVALSPEARGALSLALLRTVCAALRAVPAIEEVAVVTPDPTVRAWADARGIRTLVDHGGGLNAALGAAFEALAASSRAVLVIASDLPLLEPMDVAALLSFGARDAVVLAPSKDGLGTNAMLLPPGARLRPAYGGASLFAHRRAAAAGGLRAVLVRRPGLALDVDEPADLAYVAGALPATIWSRRARSGAGGGSGTGPS
ncbi:MAG TPA: 2-phospho-L-lactate guanylyltransferase [Candidatus Polarisedimenticolia bacterium]|nr:2-phospho-L-lactate guanylyltransferase [Candidatus Polarisedimenticolia bacterium]